jgi:hypothetical protein
MGQQASKVASKISSRLTSDIKAVGVPTTLRAPGANTASRFTDPSATEAGFTRGEGPFIDPRDEKQRQFLEKQAKNAPKEMPPDLLEFLKDAGPLQIKVEKKKKSVPQIQSKSQPQLAVQDLQVVEQKTGKNVETSPRRRELMPLAENVKGFNTVRTTSFSYRQDTQDAKDFGVGDVLDIYDLVVRKHTMPSIDEAVESFYKDRVKDRDTEWTDAETERHRELLRQTLKYVEVPVVMKDTDDSYVGAWPERVEMLQFLKLVEMPKTKVKLVLEDLMEAKKEEQKVVV